MTRRQYFTAGFKDGIPICLGYIAVSFTFGIMAKKVGISIFDAVLISLTNVTSAGQFAGPVSYTHLTLPTKLEV